ncbi:hypothetical protein [Aurantivibrio plasticivorans]
MMSHTQESAGIAFQKFHGMLRFARIAVLDGAPRVGFHAKTFMTMGVQGLLCVL